MYLLLYRWRVIGEKIIRDAWLNRKIQRDAWWVLHLCYPLYWLVKNMLQPRPLHESFTLFMIKICAFPLPYLWPDQEYCTLFMMIQRTANGENAACDRRICKRSDQPEIEIIADNVARLILHENAQRGNDMIESNWKPRIAAVDSGFDLVGSRQRCSKLWSESAGRLIMSTYSMQMVMTSDETQIQILAN